MSVEQPVQRRKAAIGAATLGSALLAVSGFLPWVRPAGGMTIGWPFQPAPILLLGVGVLPLVAGYIDAKVFYGIASTVGTAAVLGGLVLTYDAVTNDSWRPAVGLLTLALAGALLVIAVRLETDAVLDSLLS